MRLENYSDTEDEDEQQPVCPSRSQWTQQDPGLIGMNMPELIKPSRVMALPMRSSSSQDCMQTRRDLDLPCLTSARTRAGAWKLSCSTVAITVFQGGKCYGSSSRIATTTSWPTTTGRIHWTPCFSACVWPIFANLNKAGRSFVGGGQFSADEGDASILRTSQLQAVHTRQTNPVRLQGLGPLHQWQIRMSTVVSNAVRPLDCEHKRGRYWQRPRGTTARCATSTGRLTCSRFTCVKSARFFSTLM
jgi:hypothetical protein